MLFNTFAFIFGFLPVAVAGWLVLQALGWRAVAVAALFAASVWFYVQGEANVAWLLPVSLVLNYAVAQWMRTREGRARRAILLLGLAGDLLTLGYFKYTNFAAAVLTSIGALHGAHREIDLPIGVSFFTFTQIAYLVDVYRRLASEGSIVRYGLFVSYFPHLIAGPIIHHKEMMPQFGAGGRRDLASFYGGVALFAIGLFKKVAIADAVAPAASEIFRLGGLAHPPGLVTAWLGALAYTSQIYFDFSGYSDMALGISLMLGVRLPYNFNSPYKSTDLIDFWRRWHITLSRFLRDYLYFSLGGNRLGVTRRYLNLFATMVLGGLWHGAGWTFILWGALHGGALAINHAWRGRDPRRTRLGTAIGAVLTFLFVVFAWVPFRSPDLGTMAGLWAGMAGLHGIGLPEFGPFGALAHRLALPVVGLSFGMAVTSKLALALLVAFVAPNSQQIVRRFDPGLDSPGYHAAPVPGGRWQIGIDPVSAVLIGLTLGVALRGIGGYSEFIYFHF